MLNNQFLMFNRIIIKLILLEVKIKKLINYRKIIWMLNKILKLLLINNKNKIVCITRNNRIILTKINRRKRVVKMLWMMNNKMTNKTIKIRDNLKMLLHHRMQISKLISIYKTIFSWKKRKCLFQLLLLNFKDMILENWITVGLILKMSKNKKLSIFTNI